MAWNRANADNTTSEVSPKSKGTRLVFVGGLVGGLVALVLVGVFFCGKSDSHQIGGEKTRSRIKELQREPCDLVSDSVKSKNVNRATSVESNAQTDVEQTSSALPSLPDLPKPPEPIHRNPYSSASDQVISMVVNAEDGPVAPVPYTETLDRDFRESLKKPIVINDDDPESLKRAKENIIKAREELKQLLDEGMSVQEALERHREDMNFAHEMRNKAIKDMREMIEKGDLEGARKYQFKINLALQQCGIAQVDLPKSKADRMNDALRRNQERKTER